MCVRMCACYLKAVIVILSCGIKYCILLVVSVPTIDFGIKISLYPFMTSYYICNSHA